MIPVYQPPIFSSLGLKKRQNTIVATNYKEHRYLVQILGLCTQLCYHDREDSAFVVLSLPRDLPYPRPFDPRSSDVLVAAS